MILDEIRTVLYGGFFFFFLNMTLWFDSDCKGNNHGEMKKMFLITIANVDKFASNNIFAVAPDSLSPLIWFNLF